MRHGHLGSQNISGILGDKIDYTLNVIIVGPNLTLQVTNNEAESIDVDVARIQVLT